MNVTTTQHQSVTSKRIQEVKNNFLNALLTLLNADNSDDVETANFFLGIIPFESALAGYLVWKETTRCGDPPTVKSFKDFIRATVSDRTVQVIKRVAVDKVFYQARVNGNPMNGWDEDTLLDILRVLHRKVDIEEPLDIDTLRGWLNDLPATLRDIEMIQKTLSENLMRTRKIRIRFDPSISLDEIITFVQ